MIDKEHEHIEEVPVPLMMHYTYEMNHIKNKNKFNIGTVPREYLIRTSLDQHAEDQAKGNDTVPGVKRVVN